jgi:hypothetical protein
MSTDVAEFTHLSNQDLVAAVARLAQDERRATAALVASLVEFEQRRLYLAEGFPSLFAYCTQRLHLSEHAAYHRIEAARAVVRFPAILELRPSADATDSAVGADQVRGEEAEADSRARTGSRRSHRRFFLHEAVAPNPGRGEARGLGS